MLARIGEIYERLHKSVDTFSTKKGTVMASNTVLAYLIATFIGVFFLIFALLTPTIHGKILMAENITNAIDKGIDPMAVRCAYASSGDQICLAYSITHKPIEAPLAPNQGKR
jgi:hypothetical protein